jgi:hypothetical protein
MCHWNRACRYDSPFCKYVYKLPIYSIHWIFSDHFLPIQFDGHCALYTFP